LATLCKRSIGSIGRETAGVEVRRAHPNHFYTIKKLKEKASEAPRVHVRCSAARRRRGRASATSDGLGYVHSGSPAPFAHLVAVFRQSLNEAGYVDGRNVAIEYRWAMVGTTACLSRSAGRIALRSSTLDKGGTVGTD